ncbi:cathepsin b, putative, partial [Perkinsus marinus ATCC 50983]
WGWGRGVARVLYPCRDQSACGSCWAFGTVEAFKARLCIKSGGKLKQSLSDGEMLSCCNLWHGC